MKKIKKLEIGCGSGRLLHLVDIGCDVDLKQLMYATKVAKGKPLVLADARALPFRDECFDFVLASHVLEHIPQLNTALEGIKRVLECNGKVEIRLPLLPAPKDPGWKHKYRYWRHAHEFSFSEWREKIGEYFKISECWVSSILLTERLAGKFNFVPEFVRKKLAGWLVKYIPIQNRPAEGIVIGVKIERGGNLMEFMGVFTTW